MVKLQRQKKKENLNCRFTEKEFVLFFLFFSLKFRYGSKFVMVRSILIKVQDFICMMPNV